MATSGSYDYNLNATEIITEAMELCGLLGVGETITNDDKATCLKTLNLMVKAWQADGIGLWKNVEGTLFRDYESYVYGIGPSGDYCSSAGYKTEVATAADSGDSTIEVDSDDNILDGDVIGVELDDGILQWTTINGTPSGDTVTLTDVLTDDVAVDNHVYNYTSKIQRPTEIIEVRRVNPDGHETPLRIISREEYMRLPNKDQAGSATQIYYSPLLTNGKMYIYQACNDVQEYIKFTARILIEDFDGFTNDPDFPQEWTLALAWNLAVLIHPKFYGKAIEDRLKLEAMEMKASVSGYDMEDTSIYFTSKVR